MFKTMKKFVVGCCVALIGALSATTASATPTVADIWTAGDLAGNYDLMIPALVIIITAVMAVSGFRIVKKLTSRAGSVG